MQQIKESAESDSNSNSTDTSNKRKRNRKSVASINEITKQMTKDVVFKINKKIRFKIINFF